MKKELLFIPVFLFVLIGCAQQDISETEQEVTQDEEELIEPEPVIEEVQENLEIVEEETTVKVEEEIPVPEEVRTEPSQPQLVNGKTVEERIKDAYDNLHEPGSSDTIVNDFPDLVLVYTDDPEPSIKNIFPPEILPFHYYYSEEADRTFNLCGVGRSVFICKGKLDRVITKEDIDTGKCEITPIYLGDPRLGGSGRIDYDN